MPYHDKRRGKGHHAIHLYQGDTRITQRARTEDICLAVVLQSVFIGFVNAQKRSDLFMV